MIDDKLNKNIKVIIDLINMYQQIYQAISQIKTEHNLGSKNICFVS